MIDMDRVRAFLRENGPSTRTQIGNALGLHVTALSAWLEERGNGIKRTGGYATSRSYLYSVEAKE